MTDPVKRARELLKSHSRIHALADKPSDKDEDVSWLLEALADECDRLREIEAQWSDAVEAGLILTDSGDVENGHTEL